MDRQRISGRIVLLVLAVVAAGAGSTVRSQIMTREEMRDLKYNISGTGIHGSYGLFRQVSAETLPKGRFALGVSQSPRWGEGPGTETRYAIGLGIAYDIEGYLTSMDRQNSQKETILYGGLKFNVVRGYPLETFTGTFEIGLMGHEVTLKADPVRFNNLLASLHGRALFGDLEVLMSAGWLNPMMEGLHTQKASWGVGVFLPVLDGITIGAEAMSDVENVERDAVLALAGLKAALMDHLQFTVFSGIRMYAHERTPFVSLGISFSSALFKIGPNRAGMYSRIPPIPTLEELQVDEE